VLGIGRQTDYAARVVLHLAALGEGAQVQIAEIAAKRLLPPALVRRVVARLAAAGILRTVRGARGGVQLARPAAEISLLDVVRASEGRIVLNRCVDTPSACPLAEACPVHCAWTGATRALEERLEAVRFSDLAAGLGGGAGAGRGGGAAPNKPTARRTPRG
jgi:Rrf2 family protein